MVCIEKFIFHPIVISNNDFFLYVRYMILFLKFMASVLPTIDYDHTVAMTR